MVQLVKNSKELCMYLRIIYNWYLLKLPSFQESRRGNKTSFIWMRNHLRNLFRFSSYSSISLLPLDNNGHFYSLRKKRFSNSILLLFFCFLIENEYENTNGERLEQNENFTSSHSKATPISRTVEKCFKEIFNSSVIWRI